MKGQARLQFATEPYAHWSFSFAETPYIDIDVVSELYGKSFNQVTSIIAAQVLVRYVFYELSCQHCMSSCDNF